MDMTRNRTGWENLDLDKDTDADGYTMDQEYIAETDPFDELA